MPVQQVFIDVVLLEGDVIVRTYVHGCKGPGLSSLAFHVFQDDCSARCISSTSASLCQ